MKRFALFFLAAAAAWAQPAITPPQLGFIADGSGSLRPVYGVAGSFVLGDSAAAKVTSAAFSGSFGLAKLDSALIAYDAHGVTLSRIGASAGPALFGFSTDGQSALVYLPKSGEVLHYAAGRFIPRPLKLVDASVVSIAFPNPLEASVIIQREDGLWDIRARLSDGHVESQAAFKVLTAPVLELATGELVSAEDLGVLLTKPDGSQLHIPAQVPASFTLQQMSNGWLQIADLAGPARFAVRLTSGHEGFYTLPEARQ